MQQYEYSDWLNATKRYGMKADNRGDSTDLLKYGSKHAKSASKLQRIVAGCMLKIKIWKADRYEDRLNKKQIRIPEDPDGTDDLLQAIWKQTGIQGLKTGADREQKQERDQNRG